MRQVKVAKIKDEAVSQNDVCGHLNGLIKHLILYNVTSDCVLTIPSSSSPTPTPTTSTSTSVQTSGELSLSLSGNAYRNFIESISSPYSKIAYIRILKAYMRFHNYTDVDSMVHGPGKNTKQIESEIISYLLKKRQPPSSLTRSTLNTIKSCLVTFLVVCMIALMQIITTMMIVVVSIVP